MNPQDDTIPVHYANCIRVLLKFAVVMAIVGLLSGVLFQESSKKLDHTQAAAGLNLELTIHLALLHGHVFLTGVLIPIAMAAALYLARRVGGAELRRSLSWLTRGYLPAACATLGLMLYKGYHILLQARGGTLDLTQIDESFFGGVAALRHGIYAVTHIAMAVTLCVFLIALWRSLRARA